MARNRKNQSAAIRFAPALKACLLCLAIGGSGVGYVWQKKQIYELGRQIKQREMKLVALQEQNKKLRDHLALLRSPAVLDRRVRELNLGLCLPQEQQILRLKEPLPPVTEMPEGAPRQLASNHPRSWNVD